MACFICLDFLPSVGPNCTGGLVILGPPRTSSVWLSLRARPAAASGARVACGICKAPLTGLLNGRSSRHVGLLGKKRRCAHNKPENITSPKTMRVVLFTLILLVCVLALSFACILAETRACVPFRPHDGLFSNVIASIEVQLCFPRYRIMCSGWPRGVVAYIPGVPVVPDVRTCGVIAKPVIDGHACRIAQDPLLLQSPRFSAVRAKLHDYVKPGGAFAPSPELIAEARAWWNRTMRGASYIVGVHGRAALHYSGDIEMSLDSHVRLLSDEVEEEMRPGARVLLATCNSTIAALLRDRFGDAISWRVPEGNINVGNSDWGDQVTGAIARGALMDALLMSMCDVLICGSSNVVCYVAGLNPHVRLRVARHLQGVRGL